MDSGFLMTVSATKPDWTREKKRFFSWSPSRSLLASIRRYQAAERKCVILRGMIKLSCVLKHRFWSVVTGADIPLNCTIGGGLLLPHPNGVVIHPDAIIGPNCLIFQQVTIGSVEGSRAPIIGGHVDIGAGAKILGTVNIGDNVLIGANSVVLNDIKDNVTVVGIPAKET
jgi:serine O-acetyltransferase